MLYTIITILSLLVIALSYAVYNTLKKIEKYEDFIEYELQRNESLLEALRQIDNHQMFEKDDEVGSIFYQIKETIEKFKQFK
jgi:predicted Holliday junction resolvase-like endonuclease